MTQLTDDQWRAQLLLADGLTQTDHRPSDEGKPRRTVNPMTQWTSDGQDPDGDPAQPSWPQAIEDPGCWMDPGQWLIEPEVGDGEG